jgi:hypothetical protein
MDNRPIKINKSGKYNLNFIDWDNEYQNIIDSGHNMDPNDINRMFFINFNIFNNVIYKTFF